MNIVIIHGIGGHAGIHWQQWLHDMLGADGHHVIMPELPDSQRPDRITWFKCINRELSDLDLSQTIIVGHSLGVTTALDCIEQLSEPVRALVSVSGFAIDYGSKLNSYFLAEKDIDFTHVQRNLDTATVIYGDDDPYVTQTALKHLPDVLETQPIVIAQGGHLNTETGYTVFPQLLTLVEGYCA